MGWFMSWLICCLYLVGCSRVVIGVGRMSENAGQTTTAMLARANKPCSVCLGNKLDRADAMRGRLGVIRAAEPPGFRYCCARGIPNRPAGPAKKLQRFETLRLLWRCDSVCSNNTPSQFQPTLTQMDLPHLLPSSLGGALLGRCPVQLLVRLRRCPQSSKTTTFCTEERLARSALPE